MSLNRETLNKIKEEVFEANRNLIEQGLVTLTWGNVSVLNRTEGYVVIKPSGVDYHKMSREDMVVTDLEGNSLESGQLKPSLDLKTHLELYRHFHSISSVVHTHSVHAVSWSQSGRDLPTYGTTHADTFNGDIPNTRFLTENEVATDYEKNTGTVIVETFRERHLDEMAIPGILVNGHGPFTWGTSAKEAVMNSHILEIICTMACQTETIVKDASHLPDYILKKHYERKHGRDAYYGQDFDILK